MTRTLLLIILGLTPGFAGAAQPLQVSGIYPHLAAFNEHGECGVGAVVPWAGKLWFLTYPPHFRTGSTDKLYSVDESMAPTIRPESVGGTHADRMIHAESNQLIIGPYFIDGRGNVRAADVKNDLVGRMTATARHLTDPANKVYFYDMEGPVYEVDVHTLKATRLFTKPVPGWHGKGAYTGQGVFVVANNGEVAGGGIEKLPFELPIEKWSKGPEEAGVLAEWSGKEQGWKVVSRRQHTDVTGPGGLRGARNDADPIWSVGWDKRSLLLDVRDAADGAWHTYRLPKASHTYDPRHGWYTEWPRIREIVPPEGGKPARWMMAMHGMMFDFPVAFRPGHAAGLRPINSYLRYVPDFGHWNGRVVLAADDTSIMQNPMAGVSQSNLWFGRPEQLATDFGAAAGWGGVWLDDAVKAAQPSEAYLLAGFAKRVLHVSQSSGAEVTVSLEIDEKGDDQWRPYTQIKLPARGYAFHVIPPDVKGEWMRLSVDRDTTATATFHYLTPQAHDAAERSKLFAALAVAAAPAPRAVLRPGKDKELLLITPDAKGVDTLYAVDERLAFRTLDDPAKLADMHKLNDVPVSLFGVDAASVYVDTGGKRLRLPKGDAAFDKIMAANTARSIREVASERNLVNVHGTFYEVPRSDANAAGRADWRNLKPVASHGFAIQDYCTWRGLLVLAGTKPGAARDGHYFKAADGAAGLWFGALDDLWRLGKPTGRGGPWHETAVEPGKPSDPYLMTNYDRKSLTVTHDAAGPLTVTIEVDPTNTGAWRTYQRIAVPPGDTVTHRFPDGFAAHWVRLTADKECTATATFFYE
jgi:hypothetical protein